MAALTGCVSVDAPPVAPAPAPAAEPVRPGKGVAPQIVDGPAREALEAALPAPRRPRRPYHFRGNPARPRTATTGTPARVGPTGPARNGRAGRPVRTVSRRYAPGGALPERSAVLTPRSRSSRRSIAARTPFP